MPALSPSVLILEDDLNLLRLYARVLLKAGFEVSHAATIGEASVLLNSRRFDLFISDLRIGKNYCTDLISEHIATRPTPVVVISAEEQMRQVCEAMGVQFFLSKPLANAELVTLAQRLTHPTLM